MTIVPATKKVVGDRAGIARRVAARGDVGDDVERRDQHVGRDRDVGERRMTRVGRPIHGSQELPALQRDAGSDRVAGSPSPSLRGPPRELVDDVRIVDRQDGNRGIAPGQVFRPRWIRDLGSIRNGRPTLGRVWPRAYRGPGRRSVHPTSKKEKHVTGTTPISLDLTDTLRMRLADVSRPEPSHIETELQALAARRADDADPSLLAPAQAFVPPALGAAGQLRQANRFRDPVGPRLAVPGQHEDPPGAPRARRARPAREPNRGLGRPARSAGPSDRSAGCGSRARHRSPTPAAPRARSRSCPRCGQGCGRRADDRARRAPHRPRTPTVPGSARSSGRSAAATRTGSGTPQAGAGTARRPPGSSGSSRSSAPSLRPPDGYARPHPPPCAPARRTPCGRCARASTGRRPGRPGSGPAIRRFARNRSQSPAVPASINASLPRSSTR